MFRIINETFLVTERTKKGIVIPTAYTGKYGISVGKTKTEAYRMLCSILHVNGPRSLTAIDENFTVVRASLYE